MKKLTLVVMGQAQKVTYIPITFVFDCFLVSRNHLRHGHVTVFCYKRTVKKYPKRYWEGNFHQPSTQGKEVFNDVCAFP